MASSIRKRLQVFVSSTYEDLRPERQAAVEAILEAGRIPAGMELFAAGDKSQMEVIRRWIDDSDAFLLILGGRYGSIEVESGKSYTHLEFEHAVETSKPHFACMIRDEAATKRGEQEEGSKLIERDNPGKLKEFRAEVGKSLVVELWEDTKDIKLGIHKALAEIARREDLGGWVRADASFNAAEMANELARLSKENAELREKAGNVEYCGLSFHGLAKTLKDRGLDEVLLAVREALEVYSGTSPNALVQELSKSLGLSDEIRLVQCNQLINMGLIDFVYEAPETVGGILLSNERVALTNDCKRFLNRYDTEFGGVESTA